MSACVWQAIEAELAWLEDAIDDCDAMRRQMLFWMLTNVKSESE